jgi:hypothetical protein
MRQALIWRYIFLVAAPIGPAVGLVVQDVWWLAGVLLVTAVAWGVGRSYYQAADPVGLTIFLLILAYAAWLDVPAYWLIGGLLAALAVWDLGDFHARLVEQATMENEAVLWHAHWRALALALLLGLLISSMPLIIRLELSFWLAFGLALFVVIALSRLLRRT